MTVREEVVNGQLVLVKVLRAVEPNPNRIKMHVRRKSGNGFQKFARHMRRRMGQTR